MNTQTSITTVLPPEVSLTIVNGQIMASSLDVASKFGKNHKDVLKAISNLEIPDDYRGRNFAPGSYADAQGQMRPMVEMTRDGFTLLGMGFTGKEAMRWKITYINAFNAMEAELIRTNSAPPSYQIPTTMHEALRLAADLAEKTLKLETKIEEDRPKVEFAEAIYDSVGSVKVGDFAKLLNNAGVKIGQNRLYAWLREEGLLMNNNMPYQSYIDNGYFSVKEMTRPTLNGPVPYFQTRITGKGQIAIERKIRLRMDLAVAA